MPARGLQTREVYHVDDQVEHLGQDGTRGKGAGHSLTFARGSHEGVVHELCRPAQEVPRVKGREEGEACR